MYTKVYNDFADYADLTQIAGYADFAQIVPRGFLWNRLRRLHSMKRNSNPKVSYEREADVLSWEISKRPIDFAREVGNLVVHFSEDGAPVFVEILEASKFLSKANTLIGGRKSYNKKALLVH